VTASVSFSPSASASVTTSPASSLSSTKSSYPSYTVTSSRTSYATVTATSTSTGTETPSFTPLPSTNITIIYQDRPILAGYNAAVGLSAIFGFCVLACCCFMIVGRRRPDQMNQLEPIQKQITVIERRSSQVEKARRPSQVEKERNPSEVEKVVSSRRPSQAERRKSQLEVRVPEKIETA
jgi:hypothetical protein